MKDKTPIIGTGLSGLVGSKFVELYSDKYQIDNFDLNDTQRPIDITNQKQVRTEIASSPAKFVVHMAAYTNVTGAWEQTGEKNGLCYQINVEGTRNIALACQESGKHLIHISTAYVFDGKKSKPYLETDQTAPIEWYGATKAWAEEIVQDLETPWTILRIDQPFRSDDLARPDIVARIVNAIQTHNLPPQFTDHTFGPTYIDDFSKIIDWVIKTETTGLYHATSGEVWTDFELASKINQLAKLRFKVRPGLLKEYLKQTTRPYQQNTALDIGKLAKLIDFDLTKVETALKIRLS